MTLESISIKIYGDRLLPPLQGAVFAGPTPDALELRCEDASDAVFRRAWRSVMSTGNCRLDCRIDIIVCSPMLRFLQAARRSI